MTEWVVTILALTGVGVSVLAAVGICRMPDLYMRMQAATKSATLGASCLILAAGIRMESLGAFTQALLVIAFLFLTVPVSSHMIGRAAYASGVELWDRSVVDELQQQTTEPGQTLSSTEEPEE